MQNMPEWLPPMMEIIEPSEEIIIALYEVFKRDIKYGNVSFDQRSIVFSDGRSMRNYEVLFWHMITGDYHPPNVSALDIPRAARLPWCAPTINNALSGVPIVWDYEEGDGKIRTYVWLEHFEYVVILQKERIEGRGDVARLITAYSVNQNRGRRGLQNKYNNRL